MPKLLPTKQLFTEIIYIHKLVDLKLKSKKNKFECLSPRSFAHSIIQMLLYCQSQCID